MSARSKWVTCGMSVAESVMRWAMVRRRCESGSRSTGPHCSNRGSGGASMPTAASGLASAGGSASGAGAATGEESGGRAHVVVGHAAAGAGAPHGAEVHAELAREPPRRGRGGDRRTVDAGALASRRSTAFPARAGRGRRVRRRRSTSAKVISTAPTFTVWPGRTWIFSTRPLIGDGISTWALSVSTSRSGASSRIDVTLVDEDGHDLGLGQPFAEIGQEERTRHGRLTPLVGRAVGASDTASQPPVGCPARTPASRGPRRTTRADVGHVGLLAREAHEGHVVGGDAPDGRLEGEERALHDGGGDLGAGAEALRRLVHDDARGPSSPPTPRSVSRSSGESREEIDDLRDGAVLLLQHVGGLPADAKHGAVAHERQVVALAVHVGAADGQRLDLVGHLFPGGVVERLRLEEDRPGRGRGWRSRGARGRCAARTGSPS